MTNAIEPAATVPAAARETEWLVLIHQLPATPSNLRVRVWRRMQQIGAIALKQAVWLLPNLPAAREDFEWLRTEIEGLGGHATVLRAQALEAWTHQGLVDEFRKSREAAYRDLLNAVTHAEAQARRGRRPTKSPEGRVIARFRDRLAAIDRSDFFGSAGRDAVLTALQRLERPKTGAGRGAQGRTRGRTEAGNAGRLWVTRPRPGVDRISSAWLIRRFIDPTARFDFVVDRLCAPEGSVPFDMFGVEFTHRGDRCTFEVLCEVYQLEEPAVAAIAAIVHDLDLKDGRFGPDAAPTIGALIDGLQLAQADDHTLLQDGMRLFEGLYLSLARNQRLAGPRPLVGRDAASPRRAPSKRGTKG